MTASFEVSTRIAYVSPHNTGTMKHEMSWYMCGKSITLNILYGWHCRWKMDLYTTLLRLTGNLYFSKEDGKLIQSDVTVMYQQTNQFPTPLKGYQLHTTETVIIDKDWSEASIPMSVSESVSIYMSISISISIYLYLHPFHIYIYIHIHIYYLLCKMAYATSNENLNNFCSPIPSVNVFAMLRGWKLQSKM